MELRHLRYFIKAAEMLHFTRAAEALFISQPTLSVHIQQLEEELGAQLFARVGRNVRLTQAGELLLARARQAVHALETAGEEIDAISGVVRGTLSIGALPLFGSRYLPQWITAFSGVHPDVKIKARSGATEDLEAALLAGGLDLGYSLLPAEHPELNSQVLVDDQLVLVFASNHSLANKKAVTFEDIRDLQFALPSSRISSARGLLEYFERHSVQPNVVLEYDDGHALVKIVKSRNLVTCLPRFSIDDLPDLKYLPLPAEGQKIKAGALWMYLSPAAKAFLEIATALYKSESVPPAKTEVLKQ